MSKVIVRIKGGLGNQLFCYAAARRLALVNNAELVIDDVTGFACDYRYKRSYMLDHFNIKARKATPSERFEPFARYRRALIKYLSRRKAFKERQYIEQEGMNFDERLLILKVQGAVYLDGYWQSEKYFMDVENFIREDLKIKPPHDSINQNMVEKIQRYESVAIHVRWFDSPRGERKTHNLSREYYKKALAEMEKNVKNPHYFLFSDDLVSARKLVEVPDECVTCVDCNQKQNDSYLDLCLMSQCNHFIIANSTFSWWGAWLSENKNKIIIASAAKITGICVWGFLGLIPNKWIKV